MREFLTGHRLRPRLRHRAVHILAWCLIGVAGAPPRQIEAGDCRLEAGVRPVADESELPYNQPPIEYSRTAPRDPVALLQRQIERHDITLQSREKSGVLKDLLRSLRIPESSQLLVFSKSSANARLIQPATPRALYFNDDVYVGWVPGSSMIEVSAVDPTLGGTFYSLRQPPDGGIQLQRDESCLLCHLSRSTLRVPGHLVRSFTTDALGQLQTGWSRITHDTPYDKRWAGWYVTGQTGDLKHLGNVFGMRAADPNSPPLPAPAFELAKACDLTRYLSSESDVVPHLVLDHQAHGHNLITRLNYEVRLAKPVSSLEPLVRYLLFLDEPPLPNRVAGGAEYRTWFERQGRCDAQGRSLRQFDLQTRLFKHRLSYLIQSPAFNGLPETTRRDVLLRIKDHLVATDPKHPAAVIPTTERRTILQIVRETTGDLPPGW